MGYIMDLRKTVGSRPLIMAGACVLLLQDHRLLLELREDNGCWGLPGGSLEPGESMEEVAKRELYEERVYWLRSLNCSAYFRGRNFITNIRMGTRFTMSLQLTFAAVIPEKLPKTDRKSKS